MNVYRARRWLAVALASVMVWMGVAGSLALAAVLAGVAGVWWLHALSLVALAVVLVLPALAGVAGVWFWWRRARVELARAAIVYDGGGNPVPVAALAGVAYADYAALAVALAPARPALLAPDARQSAAPDARQPAPAVDLPADWLPALLAWPHLLIAGRTGSGKSTLARALLAAVARAGDMVAVIDPHAEANRWPVPAIGAGRDYAAIAAALAALDAEVTNRYQALAAGRVSPALTVIIDEVPAVAAQVSSWRDWATRIGSEARKAGVRVILLSQSPLVEDLGVNSVMRRNFASVALDVASARLLLRSLPSAQSFLDAMSSGRRLMVYEGVDGLRLADLVGIDHWEFPANASVWQPGPASPVLSMPDTDTDTDTLRVLVELVRAGYSRDRARRAGYQFDNAQWAQARRLAEG